MMWEWTASIISWVQPLKAVSNYARRTQKLCAKSATYIFTQRGESNASKTTTANRNILICWSCSAYSSYKIFFLLQIYFFFLSITCFFISLMFSLYLMRSWINWNNIVEDFPIFTHHCSTNGTSNIMLTLHCSINGTCHIYHTKYDKTLIFWI